MTPKPLDPKAKTKKLDRWFTDWIYRWALARYRRVFKQPLYNAPVSKLSEHALVRYFERIEGRNIEELRQKLLSDELKVLIKTYGGEGVFNVDGVQFSVTNGKIVSIAKPNAPTTPIIKQIKDPDVARKWSF